eukprot:TRINITY_DN30499_c0_g1_i1.p1 TRINITY_DN30499_c0_g1~~TRINITY_DN30499_c0_g1_i1.p1  ORF type:complete len:168 (+),score=33.55 TRINITY_DN30499_c0_g1_i1:86-589(+)
MHLPVARRHDSVESSQSNEYIATAVVKIDSAAAAMRRVTITGLLFSLTGTGDAAFRGALLKPDGEFAAARTSGEQPAAALSAEVQADAHWRCREACGGGESSSCITECEAAIYNCYQRYQDVGGSQAHDRRSTMPDRETDDELDACKEEVLEATRNHQEPAVGDSRS